MAEMSSGMLKNFILNNFHVREFTKDQARTLDIKDRFFEEADQDQDERLTLDEIVDDIDIAELFMSMDKLNNGIIVDKQNNNTNDEENREDPLKLGNSNQSGTGV